MSIGYIPARPEGADPKSKFMQWVYDTLVWRLRVQETPNAKVSRTTRGMCVVPSGTGGGSGGAQVAMFKIKDVADDYLLCHTWDGTTEGSTTVNVAKERRHRCSITSETIHGASHTYTYSDGPSETWAAGTKLTYNRTRTDGSETQRIVPPWIEDEVILSVKVDCGVTDGDGNPITWHILGRSCQWAKIAT